MNGTEDSRMTPLALQVDDPVAWLERHDKGEELADTVNYLLRVNRTAEAVLCLEAHIGYTAPIRARVDGWDGPWAYIVMALSRSRDAYHVELALGMLRENVSMRRPKGAQGK